MPCLGLSLGYAVAHLLEAGAKALEEPQPSRIIRSWCGSYAVELVRPIVEDKRKIEGEYISVYEGIFEGKEVIVKVYRVHESVCSVSSYLEIKALKQLRGCGHAPEYLVAFKNRCSTSAYYEDYIVMSKLPGHAMLSRPIWPVWNRRSYKAASVAFEEALSAVHARGVDNGSHHAGNVIYDPKEKKCYIIDFERVTFHDPEKAEPPQSTFEEWVGREPFI